MIYPILIILASVLVTITSVVLLIVHDWRWTIAVFGLQYIGVMLLVSTSWPLEMAIAKMVAGWMAGAVMGIAMASNPETWQEDVKSWPSWRIFRLLAAVMIIIAVLSLQSSMSEILPGATFSVTWGGLILMGLGLLHLGLTAQPLRVSIALLTLLSGFEILYSVVESSTLVAGLLAGINLVLAVAGAYLLVAVGMEEAE